MNIRIGYYPLFDMLLAFRQLFSVERFKPFNDNMNTIKDKLDPSDLEFIHTIGTTTRGWLEPISKLVDLHIDGQSNTEEILLNLLNKPDLLFGYNKEIKAEHATELLNLWRSFFSIDIAKNTKVTLDKTLEIHDKVDKKGAIDYITNISDRVKLLDENTLKFMIKPDHEEEIGDISNIIIMPSIYAVRDLTFWHSGTDYVFFISTKAQSDKTLEPSDNLLLKTMALNDKTRLKMLKILNTSHYCSTEMAEKLKMNPSTVSRHFKLFKDAGFVEIFAQEKNTVYYTLNKTEIQNSLDLIYKFIAE